MKKCPNCKQVFLDDYSYCLTDGVALENLSEADLTQEDFSNAPTKTFTAPTLKFTELKKSDLPNSPQLPVNSPAGSNKWIYLIMGILIATVIVMGYLLYKPAPPETPTVNLNPSGRWKGEWTSQNGVLYLADISLNDAGTNNFNGQIVYTVKQTSSRDKNMIGATATEYIEGVFNPPTRLLQLKGVRKDDPNSIIILDKYQLVLSEDSLTLTGNSLNGRLNVKRQ